MIAASERGATAARSARTGHRDEPDDSPRVWSERASNGFWSHYQGFAVNIDENWSRSYDLSNIGGRNEGHRGNALGTEPHVSRAAGLQWRRSSSC
jgi:hypothetical protein